ncbi:DNA repair protein RAD51 homolog 3 [Anastrepha obliqua]|uniref:DNA repair protein RAD51 homolog 3 n=1 Tax=Anastrepha obliqua TaxID=95512 RepID=UPI00240A6CF8|nr:DNA repair protein RAD51 homolog 3 [Anastrepha obliqua]
MFKTTCFDIWRQEKEMPHIVTLCKELDDKLGGGIATGLITEFCGGPGCGKTQMCLQLCINVQFPRIVGGLQSKAVYLDTNQDFSPTRLLEMAICTEKRFHRALHKSDLQTSTQTPFTANTIMNGVTYIYCKSYLTLQAAVGEMREMLNEDKAIKLIVIDSFSFPLRVIEDVAERTGILYSLLTDLQQLAVEYQLVVVITNELTTRVNGNDWKICPALGDSHAHKINQRIILSKCNEQKHFVALVEKSNIIPQVAVPFVIKQNGIRDVS